MAASVRYATFGDLESVSAREIIPAADRLPDAASLCVVIDQIQPVAISAISSHEPTSKMR
jgi:hypothetical protein